MNTNKKLLLVLAVFAAIPVIASFFVPQVWQIFHTSMYLIVRRFGFSMLGVMLVGAILTGFAIVAAKREYISTLLSVVKDNE